MKPVIILRQIIDKCRIITQPVQPHVSLKVFLWVLKRPDVDQILAEVRKADVTPAAMRHMYRENMEKYHGYRIYTLMARSLSRE